MEFIENDENIIFTRYLYIKQQVIHSLFLSLLDHNYKEALFWGYELYYSGFQQYVMDFILSTYTDLYSNGYSANFTEFINNNYNLWLSDNTKDYILGIMIRNIAIRNYDINYFIENFFKVKCHKKPSIIYNNKFRITMVNIDKYKTPEHICGKGRFILKNECKFKIRNYADEILQFCAINIKDKYYYNWLYYAYECPLWQNRIIQHNGIKNSNTKKIDFKTDDDLEEFHELYGYEPDEQLLEVQERCIGNSSVKQLSIKEFALNYDGNILYRKLIREHK